MTAASLRSRSLRLSVSWGEAMARGQAKLSMEEQMMVLQLWAYSRDILRKFSEEQIEAVPGLRDAIDNASGLPEAIGWGDENRSVSESSSPSEPGRVGRGH